MREAVDVSKKGKVTVPLPSDVKGRRAMKERYP
jgi:hypothetical protein